jgi:glycerol kinase
MTTILSIDQSTSATKAVLFDTEGRVLDRASREHRQIYPQPGWVEHDAEEIWSNVLAVIGEVALRQPGHMASLAFVSITNQRETVLVFDPATGRPLANAIVWQCRRGEPICRQHREQGREQLVSSRTGLKIDTYFSASKLQWLVEQKPDIAAKLLRGEAVVGTIDAYLIHRLTKGKVFATDSTNASRTLLFDIGKLAWDPELCELFRVPVRALPEVRESAARYGETDAEGALPRPVPIFGVMGDSQASLFAQRCYQPGMVKATFGTGTSVLLNLGDQLRVCERGAVTALAWVWRGRPTYAFEGLINFSAATITWLKDQLGLIKSSSEVGALAASVPDNGGVYLVPAFAGLSAPYWAPDARAAIVGLTGFSRREHVVRAAEESIAYQVRDVLEMMRAESGVPLRNLNADGGPTRDAFLMQFTADMSGVEIVASEVSDSSAWGAAMAGMLGRGLCGSLEELAALPRQTHTFRPQMDPACRQKFYDGWKTAVKRAL